MASDSYAKSLLNILVFVTHEHTRLFFLFSLFVD